MNACIIEARREKCFPEKVERWMMWDMHVGGAFRSGTPPPPFYRFILLDESGEPSSGWRSQHGLGVQMGVGGSPDKAGEQRLRLVAIGGVVTEIQ